MNTFPMIGTVLFVIITNLAANQLRSVNKRLEDLCHSKDDLTVSLKIRQLSLNHMELCQSVELISKSFGLILISEIAYTFVTFVVGIFIIQSSFDQYSTYAIVALFSFSMKNVVNLSITCYAANGIPKQVTKNLILLVPCFSSLQATLALLIDAKDPYDSVKTPQYYINYPPSTGSRYFLARNQLE